MMLFESSVSGSFPYAFLVHIPVNKYIINKKNNRSFPVTDDQLWFVFDV